MNESSGSRSARVELAEERTDWALQRTVLANERTFSAWIRTGMAAVAAGIGIIKLLGSTGNPWMPRAIGSIFVLVGVLVYFLGFRRYRRLYDKFVQEEMKTASIWVFHIITACLMLSALLTLMVLLMY